VLTFSSLVLTSTPPTNPPTVKHIRRAASVGARLSCERPRRRDTVYLHLSFVRHISVATAFVTISFDIAPAASLASRTNFTNLGDIGSTG
jgi:hypothetical protein